MSTRRSVPIMPVLVFLGLVLGAYFAFTGRDRSPVAATEVKVGAFLEAVAQGKVDTAEIRDDQGTVTGTLTSGQRYRVQMSSGDTHSVLAALKQTSSTSWAIAAPPVERNVLSLLSVIAIPLSFFVVLALALVAALRSLLPYGPRRA